MSVSTDAMYDAESRYIHKKLIIHFSATEVLEITKSNYLIDSQLLEESFKQSDSPFGEVTSNELSFTIYNEDGLFNPENSSGKYYRLIKKGIKVEAFIRPDEVDEWDPIGVFYVSDWVTNVSGLTAEVTANDKLYSVINGKVPSMPVYRDILLSNFLAIYFSTFNVDVTVDSLVDKELPYIYTSGYTSNKDFLTDLMKGAVADCFCDHNGNIKIVGKRTPRTLRATFNDNKQLISASIKQSITNSYDSATVACYAGQESAEQTLLSISNVRVVPGINRVDNVAFNSSPALSVRSVCATGTGSVKTTSFIGTADEFSCSLQSTVDTNVKLDVVGTVLDTVKSTLGTGADAPLSIDSNFIQTEETAKEILQFAEEYVEANIPTVELTVRGNPRLQLGDKIKVESDFYKLNYTGIIIKANYHYQGNLTCNVLLADASSIGEV